MRTPRERLRLGRPVTDRMGRNGLTAQVHCGAKYPKTYVFATHGLSPADVVERIRALDRRHATKEQKIDDLQAVARTEFTVDDRLFRIAAVSVGDRGTDPELVLSVERRVGERWERLPQMPLRRVYGVIDDVPDAPAAEAIAIAAAEQWLTKEREQQASAEEITRLVASRMTVD